MNSKKGIKISTKDGRRVVEGTGYYEPDRVNDLREIVRESAQKFGDAVAFKFKDKNKEITGKTYIEFAEDIDCLGTALMSLGLKGCRIAIISENRYEWGVCYFSVVNGVGIVVPMDKYLPQGEVENLIERSQAEAIFYSPVYHDMMNEISRSNKMIKHYICMEKVISMKFDESKFYNLPDLIDKGKLLIKAHDKSFIDVPIDKEKMSILLFTSGTTSMSKGVMLSHANIASNVTSISSIIHAGPGDVHLSLLPLHHTFESTIGLVFMVYRGVCIAYCEGVRHIAQNMQEFGVTILVAVPAILEVMYKKLREGIQKSGKEKLFNLMAKVSAVLRTFGIDARRRLFGSVLKKLGPDLRIIVSGAAPLAPDIIEGFDTIGLKVLQGYGLTETSPVAAANNDFANRIGTVGYPPSGVEVAIDSPDENGMGEILIRGRNVMLGYYEDQEATNDSLDAQGWFRTGDLGVIDSDGFIKITGRAKSMIVFTNGKKAFPEEYESLLNNIPFVKESFVWGNKALDGDIQICAELVLDKEKFTSGKTALPSGNVISLEDVPSFFLDEIKNINNNLPQYKIIRYFIISTEDITRTTTLKIKRPVEYEKIMKILEKAGIDMRKASGKYIYSL